MPSSPRRQPIDGTANNRRSVLYSTLDEGDGSSSSISNSTRNGDERPFVDHPGSPTLRAAEPGERSPVFAFGSPKDREYDEESQEGNAGHTWSKGVNVESSTGEKRKSWIKRILIACALIGGAVLVYYSFSSIDYDPALEEQGNVRNAALKAARGSEFHPVGGQPAEEPEIMTEPIGDDPKVPDEDAQEFEKFSDPQGTYRVTIIHTNDIHSHLDAFNDAGHDCSEEDIKEGDCFGGVARHKKIIDRVRKERGDKRRVLLMDAGDQFQGTLYYKVHKGEASAAYMNEFKYDVATLG